MKKDPDNSCPGPHESAQFEDLSNGNHFDEAVGAAQPLVSGIGGQELLFLTAGLTHVLARGERQSRLDDDLFPSLGLFLLLLFSFGSRLLLASRLFLRFGSLFGLGWFGELGFLFGNHFHTTAGEGFVNLLRSADDR